MMSITGPRETHDYRNYNLLVRGINTPPKKNKEEKEDKPSMPTQPPPPPESRLRTVPALFSGTMSNEATVELTDQVLNRLLLFFSSFFSFLSSAPPLARFAHRYICS